MQKILVIDNEETILDLVDAFLKNDYDVIGYKRGDKAIEIFKKNFIPITIVDLKLSNDDITGFKVLKTIKKLCSECQVIITGTLDSRQIQKALRLGAVDYICKPFDHLQLQHSVQKCYERYNLIKENIEYQKDLEKKIKEKTHDYMVTNARLNNILYKIVESLTKIVELRDPYTAGHQRKVTLIALKIAKRMNLTKKQQENIFFAGNLHDIGKIYVPQDYLNKPGKLSKPELVLIQEHCEKGYEILSNIPFKTNIAEMVRQHHEKMDGSGYPYGLKGNEIRIESRILVIADILEAVSSNRPYRKSLGINQSISILKKGIKNKTLWKEATKIALDLLKECDNDIEKLLKE